MTTACCGGMISLPNICSHPADLIRNDDVEALQFTLAFRFPERSRTLSLATEDVSHNTTASTSRLTDGDNCSCFAADKSVLMIWKQLQTS